MLKIVNIILLFAGIFCSCSSLRHQQPYSEVFSNPLLDKGADPYSFYKEGFYYYTHTTGTNITIWKTRNLADLRNAEKKVVWVPPPNTMYSKQIWAPEILFLDGKWYLYFAADDGNNNNHRMYVLENTGEDPMQGEWIFKGKISDETDKWAIDGDVFRHNGQLYMVWSGWEGDENGEQNIYIAKMNNPWTISSERVKISSPQYDWERHKKLPGPNPDEVFVNEGPQFLEGKDKIFIVYSASGCWTDNYTLGMLWADENSELMDAKSWKKSAEPVFKPTPGDGVYAAGHNSFFKSPDGKENWILYHANSQPGQGCGWHRSPRMQKIVWNKDGTPNLGKPMSTTKKLKIPSGM